MYFLPLPTSPPDLLPQINAFWPQTEVKVHIDAWREVNTVDGYQVKVSPKGDVAPATEDKKLFFINLGGYNWENKIQKSRHYIVLTVKDNRAQASREAKETLFYRENQIPGGTSHIDDKYGVDVDDLYEIEDILSPSQKELYQIELTPAAGLPEDELHLGYVKLSLLEQA